MEYFTLSDWSFQISAYLQSASKPWLTRPRLWGVNLLSTSPNPLRAFNQVSSIFTPLPLFCLGCESLLVELIIASLLGNHKRRMTNSRSVIKVTMPPVSAEPTPEEDESAGAEDEQSALDDSNAGDDTLYCFCQKVSFGKVRQHILLLSVGYSSRRRRKDWFIFFLVGGLEFKQMIGCDNKHCRYEWFHVPCLGIKETPTGKWFCPECSGDEPKTGTKATQANRSRKRSWWGTSIFCIWYSLGLRTLETVLRSFVFILLYNSGSVLCIVKVIIGFSAVYENRSKMSFFPSDSSPLFSKI